MSVDRFFVRPVTVVTAGARTDRYGNAAGDDWGSGATRRHTNGWLTQTGATEALEQRDGFTTGRLLQLPAGDPITGTDRVEIDGEVFTVGGVPARPWSSRGEHRVKVQLEQVTG